MKNLFDGSRISFEEDSRIYVQGDYTHWHNEDEDILEGQDLPLRYTNLELIQIDQDGLWLEQKGKETLLEDNTWCLYETDCTGVKENYIDAEVLKKELGVEDEEVQESEEMQLGRRVYKRIAKYSTPEYWNKNIDFFKKLYLKMEQGKFDEVNLIEIDNWGDLSSKLYYSLLEIDGNCIPVPIVIKVINLFGTYDLSTRNPTKDNLKKAYKTWDTLERTFNKIDMEEYEEMKIQRWSEITAIEKVATFVANFMKKTGVESKQVISDIMDNLHKYCEYDFDNLEFRNIEFIKQDNPKDFAHDIILNSQSREHSWAGKETNEDTATLLYSSDSNFEFGQDYSYEYSNNGNTEREDSDYSDGNFNISSTYVILIKTEQHSTYNRDYYNYVGYKCIAYVGDEVCYKFEHEDIIKKYDIDKKVLEVNNEN
jgi:hypothetical protein